MEGWDRISRMGWGIEDGEDGAAMASYIYSKWPLSTIDIGGAMIHTTTLSPLLLPLGRSSVVPNVDTAELN